MSDRTRDKRRTNWLWIDNAILKDCGAEIGDSGIAVYACLAMHAGQDETCFPGIGTIAEMIGRSENYVRKALDKLVDAKLISITPRADDSGRQTSNLYTLLDVQSLHAMQGDPPQFEGGRVHSLKGDPSQFEDELESVNQNKKNKNKDNKSSSTTATSSDFNIMAAYQKMTGNLVYSLYLAEDLNELEQEYPVDWIEQAFRESAEKRSLPYAKAILKRWKDEGKPQPGQTKTIAPQDYTLPPAVTEPAPVKDEEPPEMKAWGEVMAMVAMAYDKALAAKISSLLYPVAFSDGRLVIDGDEAYWQAVRKTLANAAGPCGYEIGWVG